MIFIDHSSIQLAVDPQSAPALHHRHQLEHRRLPVKVQTRPHLGKEHATVGVCRMRAAFHQRHPVAWRQYFLRHVNHLFANRSRLAMYLGFKNSQLIVSAHSLPPLEYSAMSLSNHSSILAAIAAGSITASSYSTQKDCSRFLR